MPQQIRPTLRRAIHFSMRLYISWIRIVKNKRRTLPSWAIIATASEEDRNAKKKALRGASAWRPQRAAGRAPLNGIELDRSRDLSRDVAGFGEDDAALIRDAEPLFRAGRNA